MSNWKGEAYDWNNWLAEKWELIQSPSKECSHLIYIATDQAIEIGGYYPAGLAWQIMLLPQLVMAAKAVCLHRKLLPESDDPHDKAFRETIDALERCVVSDKRGRRATV